MKKAKMGFNSKKNEEKKALFKSIKKTKKYAYARNPYGRRGKPNFMKSVIKGMENFLETPFK